MVVKALVSAWNILISWNSRRKATGGGGICDGEHVQLSDPVDCCLFDDVQDCGNQFGGCKDHYAAERE